MSASQSSALEAPACAPHASGALPDWKQIIAPAEPFLAEVARRLEEQIAAFEPEISAYAAYALTQQGKQLRPALVALSGLATGGLTDAHARVAMIIEMVHLATLVHDDVMDEAEMRRGRPTLAVNWGNEVSVLLGDCLFAHALKLAASFPTPEVCRAVASSTNTVCTGEILQTQRFTQVEPTRDEYFRIVAMKTGELFALACELGAFLNETSEAVQRGLRDFGMAIGTAYQVYDDCVDLFGTEQSAGKSLGTDLAKGKLTLPMLVLLERAPRKLRAEVRTWIRDWHPERFAQVRELLLAHEALGESQRAIEQYLQQAREALGALPETPSRAGLEEVADYIAQLTEALRS